MPIDFGVCKIRGPSDWSKTSRAEEQRNGAPIG